VGVIAKVRHLLPQSLTRTLYLTLVEPYINYCNIVWAAPDPTTKLDKVLKIQKKYCRLITFSKYKAHTKEIFQQLKILNVYDIHKLQLACHMYKLRNHQLPDIYNLLTNADIHSHNTRHKNDLRKEPARTKGRQDTVRFRGPTLWNSFSQETKSVPTLNIFKKKIKQFLILGLEAI
jgi:hypothetical protein